ncbi:MAG: NAD(P)H-hydrate dehydratase [Bacteroidia bacterium]|jgi:NAD(P)H-hydrate epimerase|nr:NAD(P)H-hydrate dehydratase [Bacteroidia bacterium]
MKLLSTAQIREADAYTIAHEPIASVALMERAAAACVPHISELVNVHETVYVVCGNGNNGGDGLVIARHLQAKGYQVIVLLVKAAVTDSADFAHHLNLLRQTEVQIIEWNSIRDYDLTAHVQPVVVDAIFGSGLNREPDGVAAAAIEMMNAAQSRIISVDIPSGLFGDDNRGNKLRYVANAAYTLTFHQPKAALLFAETGRYAGVVRVIDIGLHRGYIDAAPTPYTLLTPDEIQPLLRSRAVFSHKGSYGHALLCAGSRGKTGAAVLAVNAALRSGCGLVTALVPQMAESILHTAAPEAMLQQSEAAEICAGRVRHTEKFTAAGFGPGWGTAPETAQLLKQWLQEAPCPTVLDADALNILAENKTWLAFLPPGTLLTPHPGEFDRLAGAHTSAHERFLSQLEFSRRFNCYVVLKGAYTSITTPDGRAFFNTTGNAGMAKGGSGDVLTGLITGLRARGYDALQAAVLGVYLHGKAGDIAAAAQSQEAMKAGDIIEALPGAFLHG